MTPQQLLARLPEDELAVKVSREDLEVRERALHLLSIKEKKEK